MKKGTANNTMTVNAIAEIGVTVRSKAAEEPTEDTKSGEEEGEVKVSEGGDTEKDSPEDEVSHATAMTPKAPLTTLAAPCCKGLPSSKLGGANMLIKIHLEVAL